MYRFSLRLLRDGSTGEEWVEPADEVERLVFLRSRIVFFVVWCGVLDESGRFVPSQVGIGDALSRRLSNVDVQPRK